MSDLTRRDFLKFIGASGATAYIVITSFFDD